MKQTIKIGAAKALTIEPQDGKVKIEFLFSGVPMASELLDSPRAELIAFAMGQAAKEAKGEKS